MWLMPRVRAYIAFDVNERRNCLSLDARVTCLGFIMHLCRISLTFVTTKAGVYANFVSNARHPPLTRVAMKARKAKYLMPIFARRKKRGPRPAFPE